MAYSDNTLLGAGQTAANTTVLAELTKFINLRCEKISALNTDSLKDAINVFLSDNPDCRLNNFAITIDGSNFTAIIFYSLS